MPTSMRHSTTPSRASTLHPLLDVFVTLPNPSSNPSSNPSPNAESQKRAAAERAVTLVQSGMRIGLGTGSTAKHVLDVIGAKIAAGALTEIIGVPTSKATAEYAKKVGIALTTLDDVQQLDIAIDGADEVDPALQLIKGLGGALLWEKIVESAADRLVIVVDESKLVGRLGTLAPLPVEVVPFGW